MVHPIELGSAKTARISSLVTHTANQSPFIDLLLMNLQGAMDTNPEVVLDQYELLD